jgi:hypothetical protein
MSTLVTLIQYGTRNFSQSHRQEEEIKKIKIKNRKLKIYKEVKSIFADNMILSLEDPKDSTKGFLA